MAGELYEIRLNSSQAVIPCALRHEMTLRRHGILKNAGALEDPVSAAHHSVLHCARDDNKGRQRNQTDRVLLPDEF
jgi:hypothetical protein